MQCQRKEREHYVVVIKPQKSLRTQCGEAWKLWIGFLRFLFGLSFVFLVYGLTWILAACQNSPDLSLDSMTIRNMTLYQNSSIPPSESPWQVDSSFTVNLSASNPNTVAGCFCTIRRVIVRVEYRGQLILQQEMQLDGLGIKPRATRLVTVDVKGEGFQLKNSDLGPFMQNELRNGTMFLDFYFKARYLRNDRSAFWVNFGCLVLAQVPNFTQVGANNVLQRNCIDL